MKFHLRIVSFAVLVVCAMQASGVTLTPHQIRGGNIPGNYSDVNFFTSDGNWAQNIALPKMAADKATITIHANAPEESNLYLTNTDIPLASINLSIGYSQKLVFSAAQQRWLMDMAEYTPNSVGAALPSNTRQFTRYKMSDGNWVSSITLPVTALPDAVIVIESSATYTGSISADNIIYAGSMGIRTGEKYLFKFNSKLDKWYIVVSPILLLQAKDLINGNMGPSTQSRTVLTLPKDTASLSIGLPKSAGDRDRLSIVSQSDSSSTIRNAGVDFSGSMEINKGDTYNFMWVEEKKAWVKMSSPSRWYNAGALKNGAVPAESIPTKKIYSSDDNWGPIVTLPVNAKPGDRVLFKSDATSDFQVVPGGKAATFSSHTVSTGDNVAFIVDAKNRWQMETGTITILNIYSDKVAIALGEQGARARQLESFRLTNEALENSRVNFRLKMVGLMRHRDQGATLPDALARLRDDWVVQTERKRLKANAIYYEGAEQGCGWASVNASSYRMIGTGSMNCGTAIMRHEFGHNMGLSHADNGGGSTPYATGSSVFGTIMGGNHISYYSTPKIYDRKLGMALGIAGKIDAVRAMNERFLIVSKY